MRMIFRFLEDSTFHLTRRRIQSAVICSLVFLVALVAVALALALGQPMTAHAADLKAIEEAARKEGPMTWYVSLYSQAIAEKTGAAFAQKYPGLKIIPVRSTTGGSFQRLMQDLKSNVAVASVFSTTGQGGQYQILKRDGRLAEYTPANGDKLVSNVTGAITPGYVYPMGAGLLAMAYNTAKVKAEDAPKSWMDLTDPKWKKKLALGHPAFSGFDASWCVSMMKKVGWKYYEDLAKNEPLVQRSTFDTLTALNSGERVVSTLPDAFAIDALSKGNPIAVVYPTDGSEMILGYTAILKNAPQPNMARLFTEFLLDVEHAKVVADNGYVSVRPEVVTILHGGKRVDQVALLPVNTAEEAEKALPDIVEKWRNLFGQ
jgi:iron(III) transport system substrate-binding protein